MPNGSGVRWAECLLIIGMGCRVQVFALSSIAQSVCQRIFSLLEIGFQRPSGFESCMQQRKTTCLLSIRKSLACARASKLTTTNMCVHVCVHITATRWTSNAVLDGGVLLYWMFFVTNTDGNDYIIHVAIFLLRWAAIYFCHSECFYIILISFTFYDRNWTHLLLTSVSTNSSTDIHWSNCAQVMIWYADNIVQWVKSSEN